MTTCQENGLSAGAKAEASKFEHRVPGIWGPKRLTKRPKLKSFRGARDRKTVKFPTFERLSQVLVFGCGASAVRRVQPMREPARRPPSGGFRCPRQQGSVLPLIETKGVAIGTWTRDAGTRVPRSTKRRLFRSVDRARAVGYGTSPSTALQSKFLTRPIFQIGFS
jgi:hypothetical protein